MFFVNLFDSRIPKTHNFQNLEPGIDYCVDFTESGKVATLTTTWTVKLGDKLTLPYQHEIFTYQVENVEYYWNDDSMRIILLKRI